MSLFRLLSSLAFLSFVLLASCVKQEETQDRTGVGQSATLDKSSVSTEPYIVVLGIAQDAGYPQAGCHKKCCERAHRDPKAKRYVVSMAIVDPKTKQRWFLECTPDFREQLHDLDKIAPSENSPGISGIFLTHAHIGHYTGLVHLGREAMGTKNIPVYTMPRMEKFLSTNGPWNQLVKLKNIELRKMTEGKPVKLNERIRVTPLLVPHRDEFSETVAFRIRGPNRTVLFLPDIDKWDRWKTPIEDVLKDVDIAYLDGSFFANGELPNRDMSLIPHPFIVESIARFRNLPKTERTKIRFIHFNHTNPVLDPKSDARKTVEKSGHGVAKQGEKYTL